MTAFTSALECLEPISLAELNLQAELMTRVDRKYFVPREHFASMATDLASEFRVLEIDGLRTFRYRTVYFDTPDFGFFRQHAQRHRHRFKVRTRTYCESGDLKHHGPRDVLVETKSSGAAGPLDRVLLDAGLRPHSVSKYCVAASLLYAGLPSNDWHRTLRRHFGADPTAHDPLVDMHNLRTFGSETAKR